MYNNVDDAWNYAKDKQNVIRQIIQISMKIQTHSVYGDSVLSKSSNWLVSFLTWLKKESVVKAEWK